MSDPEVIRQIFYDAIPYGNLQFVREAAPSDEGVAHAGGTLWEDPATEARYWLHPNSLVRHGLTERMRAALSSRVEDEHQLPRTHAQSFPDVRSPEPRRPEPTVLAGQTVEWRWQAVWDERECQNCEAGIVTDEDPHRRCNYPGCENGVVRELLWAIDNKPQIEAHEDVTRPAPTYHHAVIPSEILEAIVRAA